MHRKLTGACLLLALVLSPLAAQDAKTDKDKPKDASKADKAKKDVYIPTGQRIVGKLLKAEDKQLTVEYGRQKIEVAVIDDVKVRMRYPPPEFDEKGRPKKYTRKEFDQLKGPDKKLEGYAADFGNLKPNQIVTVYLGRLKTATPTRGKTDNKPMVIMVVIEREPPS